ncbi:SDR family oxidoreductase [Pendulispora rubella]|uniref:SDR family oxidoreductase n=1 Tax=Pendulispora rubella TaxID=2741070 RepID=A0ABZ2LH27_9BACT
MTTSALLVTGASGQLGRQVLDDLLARKVQGSIIATTRNPESLAAYAAKGIEVRQADFEGDPGALAKAFSGASRALLISTDALDKPGRRLAQHRAAIKAFEAAGVKHVVYTSLTNPYAESPILIAPDHRESEAALAASRLEFTVLRNNLYIDLLVGSLPHVLASGKLVDARGTGATGFVTRQDCALAAAAALSSPYSGRRTLEITGPAAVTSAQVATWLTELSGKPVQHVSVSPEAFTAGLIEHGLPAPLAAVIASFDVAVTKGDLAVVTSAVKELTGREPQTVRDFLAAQRATFN